MLWQHRTELMVSFSESMINATCQLKRNEDASVSDMVTSHVDCFTYNLEFSMLICYF